MHWTYCKIKETDLEQGDILKPTDDLKALLAKVHPDFCDEKYTSFAIATQSCDMVRRNGKSPKADYINIVTVQQLNEVLPFILSSIIRPVSKHNIFNDKDKLKAKQLLERLFNQNEKALGLFFLKSDSDIELGNDSVVFLRASVALESKHYEILLDARIGRLDPEYRGRFGWLIGNLFSRTAARGWSDHGGGKIEYDKLIKKYLNEDRNTDSGPIWVDNNSIESALKAKEYIQELDLDQVLKVLEKHRPAPTIDQAINSIIPDLMSIFKSPKILSSISKEFEEALEKIERLTSNIIQDFILNISESNGDLKRVFEQNMQTLKTRIEAALNEQVTYYSNAETLNRLSEEISIKVIRTLKGRLSNNGKLKNLLK